MTTDFSRSTSPSRGPSPAAAEGSADTPNTPAGRGFRLLGMSGRPLAAVLVCWFFVIFDGYDLIVYGTVQSTLMKHWDLSSGEAGTVGSLAFFGMAVGAVGVGRISDRVGRKTAVIGSVLILSVFTASPRCARSPRASSCSASSASARASGSAGSSPASTRSSRTSSPRGSAPRGRP